MIIAAVAIGITALEVHETKRLTFSLGRVHKWAAYLAKIVDFIGQKLVTCFTLHVSLAWLDKHAQDL